MYGLLSGQPTPFPLRTALQKCLTIRGYTLFEVVRDDQRLAAGKKYIYDRLQDGRFRPIIAKIFPFEQSVQAYQYLESNQQIGELYYSQLN